jgi:hypothetical protein
MPTSTKPSVLPLEGRYEPGAFFDEMFEASRAEQRAALSVEELEPGHG